MLKGNGRWGERFAFRLVRRASAPGFLESPVQILEGFWV